MQRKHPKVNLGRKGQSTIIAACAIILVIIAAVFAGTWFYDKWNAPSQGKQYSIVQAGNGGGAQEMQSTGNNCGTARTTTVTFSQTNGLNTTGSEPFNSTCYVYKVAADGSETYVTTSTDQTTSAGTMSADCNQKYRMYCISTDANGGDSGQILGVVGDGVKVITAKDNKDRDVPSAGIEFLTNAPTYPVTWQGKQHATLQFKAYDMAGLTGTVMYDESDAITSDYETDGVNFTSTSGNTTATAVGSGGWLKVQEEIQATDVDTDFSDFGFYIAVKAATTVWDADTVTAKFTSASGSTSSLSNLKSNLDKDENSLFDSYQYLYFVPDSIRQDSAYFTLNVKALSGVNPGTSDDVEIDYVSKGAALRTGGVSKGVRFSASTDASSKSAIYAIQDTNIATS
jgi:hypothetical protein